MKTPEIIKKFYKSKEWFCIRNYIYKKYNYRCGECGKPKNMYNNLEVHHIIPLTLENFNDINIRLGESNLIPLCTSCHDAKRSEGLIRKDVMFDENGDLISRNSPPTPWP